MHLRRHLHTSLNVPHCHRFIASPYPFHALPLDLYAHAFRLLKPPRTHALPPARRFCHPPHYAHALSAVGTWVGDRLPLRRTLHSTPFLTSALPRRTTSSPRTTIALRNMHCGHAACGVEMARLTHTAVWRLECSAATARTLCRGFSHLRCARHLPFALRAVPSNLSLPRYTFIAQISHIRLSVSHSRVSCTFFLRGTVPHSRHTPPLPTTRRCTRHAPRLTPPRTARASAAAFCASRVAAAHHPLLPPSSARHSAPAPRDRALPTRTPGFISLPPCAPAVGSRLVTAWPRLAYCCVA